VASLLDLLGHGWIEQLCLEDPMHLFVRQTLLTKGFHKSLDPTSGETNLLRSSFRGTLGRDVSSRAMPEFQQALMFEFGIDFGNGVVADHKLFGQGSDSWQLIAMLKDARFDAVAYLLHELQVERLPSRRIELEDQGSLYHC
jgi:hypothetical protein